MVARPAVGETKSAGSSFFLGLLLILLGLFLSVCCTNTRGDCTCTCDCNRLSILLLIVFIPCSCSSKRLRLAPASNSSWSSCVTKKLTLKVPTIHTSRNVTSRRESLEVVTILVSFFFLGGIEWTPRIESYRILSSTNRSTISLSKLILRVDQNGRRQCRLCVWIASRATIMVERTKSERSSRSKFEIQRNEIQNPTPQDTGYVNPGSRLTGNEF
jgi:hypothetical protein